MPDFHSEFTILTMTILHNIFASLSRLFLLVLDLICRLSMVEGKRQSRRSYAARLGKRCGLACLDRAWLQ